MNGQLHAPTLVKNLVRMLRKADSTVLVFPFQEDNSQNNTIESEDLLP